MVFINVCQFSYCFHIISYLNNFLREIDNSFVAGENYHCVLSSFLPNAFLSSVCDFSIVSLLRGTTREKCDSFYANINFPFLPRLVQGGYWNERRLFVQKKGECYFKTRLMTVVPDCYL